MQLKEALRLKGYKVKDLYDRLIKRYLIDYQTVARYCRCSNRSTLNKDVWSWIDVILKEMEVEWNGR